MAPCTSICSPLPAIEHSGYNPLCQAHVEPLALSELQCYESHNKDSCFQIPCQAAKTLWLTGPFAFSQLYKVVVRRIRSRWRFEAVIWGHMMQVWSRPHSWLPFTLRWPSTDHPQPLGIFWLCHGRQSIPLWLAEQASCQLRPTWVRNSSNWTVAIQSLVCPIDHPIYTATNVEIRSPFVGSCNRTDLLVKGS